MLRIPMVLASLLLLSLAGCTGDPPPINPSSTGATSTPAAKETGVRECQSSVVIFRTPSQEGSVGAGPVLMRPLEYAYGTALTQDPDAEGYRSYKIAMIVAGQDPVTVAIPEAYRGLAKLTYEPGAGDYTTEFRPCSGLDRTQFAGGIAVREPVCLPLTITWDGQSARLQLAFGEGVCP